MTTRLELLRKSLITKNAIDAVFLRNKQMLGVTEDDVMREPYKKSDLVYRAIADCKKDPIKGYLAVQILPQLEDQSREMQNYLTDLLK